MTVFKGLVFCFSVSIYVLQVKNSGIAVCNFTTSIIVICGKVSKIPCSLHLAVNLFGNNDICLLSICFCCLQLVFCGVKIDTPATFIYTTIKEGCFCREVAGRWPRYYVIVKILILRLFVPIEAECSGPGICGNDIDVVLVFANKICRCYTKTNLGGVQVQQVLALSYRQAVQEDAEQAWS